jgi:quinol monooxygenase YgiN
MFGLIGKMTVAAGQRETVIEHLLAGTGAMPGCLSYIVARDTEDADGIWITEVWDSESHHRASLSLSAVRDAISKVRPLITGFSHRTVTDPAGGVGLGNPGAGDRG